MAAFIVTTYPVWYDKMQYEVYFLLLINMSKEIYIV